eukprot:TRINITY_DN56430_c0_g1_i1.p1 TRINITY_DN56430_c0_g1~~TRINITY_DN56430_c0_g1_i1.p1  ORF type:complete len:394 (-),score=31.02 TRINITY_DN56430_c0_g1_i1:293-1390(-)
MQARATRRRNSYKYYMFYLFDSIMSLILAIMSAVFSSFSWSSLIAVHDSCQDLSNKTDSFKAIQAYMDTTSRTALTCTGEGGSIPACEISSINNYYSATDGLAAFNFMQWIVSFILAKGFRTFCDLPVEELQCGKVTRKLMVLGFVCKHGPWIARVFRLIIVLIWLVLVLYVGGLKACKGNAEAASRCIEHTNECHYNKVKNCLYNYQLCADKLVDGVVDAAKVQSCFDSASSDTSKVGVVDARLICSTNAARCKYLSDPAADLPGDCAPDVEPANKPVHEVQGCVWGEANSAFLFFEQDCAETAASSVLYKYMTMFSILSGACLFVTTALGQALRLVVVKEPWFFNPKTHGEYMIKRILRWSAP